MPSWTLVDADPIAAENPYTFYKPSRDVIARMLNEGEKVGYLYREASDDEEDRGWRIMAGDESDAYMDDPKNLACVSLGAVLSCDDAFRDLLDAPVGSAFTRSARTGAFEPDEGQ